jgi:hypothetical protein
VKGEAQLKKKKLSHLTLHRETIQRLDEPTLRELAGAVAAAEPPSSQACCPAPANDGFKTGTK